MLASSRYQSNIGHASHEKRLYQCGANLGDCRLNFTTRPVFEGSSLKLNTAATFVQEDRVGIRCKAERQGLGLKSVPLLLTDTLRVG